MKSQDTASTIMDDDDANLAELEGNRTQIKCLSEQIDACRAAMKRIVTLLDERRQYLPNDFASLFYNSDLDGALKELNREI